MNRISKWQIVGVGGHNDPAGAFRAAFSHKPNQSRMRRSDRRLNSRRTLSGGFIATERPRTSRHQKVAVLK
jgi:hypothetical protein